MSYAIRQGIRLSLLWFIIGLALSVSANPNDYPEYANIKIAQNIEIQFIAPEDVKNRLDAGAPQVLVDVRNQANFEKSHLPGAISIPLRTLEARAEDIPRETPVVLY